MDKNVVITGSGIVSAIGNNKQQCYASLVEGRGGIAPVRYLHTTHTEYPVGEVKMSNGEMAELLGLKSGEGYSRTELMGIIALKEALEEAQLKDVRAAFVSGTTVGGMDMTEQSYPDNLTPELLDRHDCGASTNRIADYFGVFNFTSTISTACSSATNAIIFGARLIQSGMRDVVVVGGSESLTRFHLNGFKSLMILDEEVCKPFDVARKGLNLGEGAAYLVLESEAFARRRGAKILARYEGGGNACDAFHQTASSPDGEGAFLAMREALHEAGLMPEEIQYVNAHGTGTPNNDASESAALRRVFGDALPAVSSTKGFTGHTTSASGSIESVFCLLALQHRFIPQNLNWQTCDEECIVPAHGVLADDASGSKEKSEGHDDSPVLNHVMCNGFGFGGNDSTVILGRFEQGKAL